MKEEIMMTDLTKPSDGEMEDTNDALVRIARPGATEQNVEYVEGDTVATVLARAGVVVDKGYTVTLGRAKVDDPAVTLVRAGDVLVIAGKPSNG
jgi:hypothetical protein